MSSGSGSVQEKDGALDHLTTTQTGDDTGGLGPGHLNLPGLRKWGGGRGGLTKSEIQALNIKVLVQQI